MFCSKFSWSCHMNLNLAILWDFAEGCILEPLARELLLLLLHIHLPIYVFQLSYLIQLQTNWFFFTSIFFFRLNIPNCKDMSMAADVPAKKLKHILSDKISTVKLIQEHLLYLKHLRRIVMQLLKKCKLRAIKSNCLILEKRCQKIKKVW